MFSFISIAFNKIVSVVAGAIIAVGIVQVPRISDAPVVVKSRPVIIQDQKGEDRKVNITPLDLPEGEKKNKDNKPPVLLSPSSNPSAPKQNAVKPTKESPSYFDNVVTSKKDLPTKNTKPEDENFKELIITGNAKYAEEIKRFIDSVGANIADMKERRGMLANRVEFIKKNLYFTKLVDDTITFNKMIDVYVEGHETEIKNIDYYLSNIQANIDFMSGYRAEYNRIVNELLNNPNIFISNSQLVDNWKHEGEVMQKIYDSESNVRNGLIYYYQGVIDNENQYAGAWVVLKDALSKIIGTPSVNASNYYQPMPQYDAGLTVRQQLLVNPIICNVDGNAARTTVICR